jgi:hypothetical protein
LTRPAYAVEQSVDRVRLMSDTGSAIPASGKPVTSSVATSCACPSGKDRSMRDGTVELPDGRTLGYTDLGAPEGPLVFYFHGAPSSRLDLVAFDDAFTDRGVRVVCPERPSYGVSSPHPRRQREDWPGDVAELADSLGLSVSRSSVFLRVVRTRSRARRCFHLASRPRRWWRA